MIYTSYKAGFVYICSTSTLPETQKMNFSYKVEAHWRQKKTHKTSTTVNPLWPIPNAPETLDHTIEHDQTHHRTHEPITPTQNANAIPTHQSDHHKVQTHITTNKTHPPYQITKPQIWSHLLTTIFEPLSTNKGTGESKEKREKWEKKEKGEDFMFITMFFVFVILC